jgi:cytochrome c oxidase subunit III
MKERVRLDLSSLPLHGFDEASPTWWGTLAFMLLEGSGFAVAFGMYLYLLSIAPAWPLSASLPRLGPGTLVTGLLLISLVPNFFVGRWAKKLDLPKARLGTVVMSLFGIAPVVVRAYEFAALNVGWDTNAYGSILWLLLGIHTTHLITDLADTLVLAVLLFTRHAKSPRRLGDVQDNVLYWNFVVLAWLPIYFCIYWIPRL